MFEKATWDVGKQKEHKQHKLTGLEAVKGPLFSTQNWVLYASSLVQYIFGGPQGVGPECLWERFPKVWNTPSGLKRLEENTISRRHCEMRQQKGKLASSSNEDLHS